MVTTYNTKDMVSFGKYLLSNERRELFASHPGFGPETLEQRLSEVHHSDFENWKYRNEKHTIESLRIVEGVFIAWLRMSGVKATMITGSSTIQFEFEGKFSQEIDREELRRKSEWETADYVLSVLDKLKKEKEGYRRDRLREFTQSRKDRITAYFTDRERFRFIIEANGVWLVCQDQRGLIERWTPEYVAKLKQDFPELFAAEARRIIDQTN